MNLNSILFPAPKSSYTIELLNGELIWVPKFSKNKGFDSSNSSSLSNAKEGRQSTMSENIITQEKKSPTTILVEEIKNEFTNIEKDEFSAPIRTDYGISLQNQQSLEIENKNELVTQIDNKGSILENFQQKNHHQEDQNFTVNMHNEINGSKIHLEGSDYSERHTSGTHMHDTKPENCGKTKSLTKKRLSIEIKDSSLIDSKRREEEEKIDGSFDLHSIDEYVGIKNLISPKSLPNYSTRAITNPNFKLTRSSVIPTTQTQLLLATDPNSNQISRPFSFSVTPGVKGSNPSQSQPYFLSANQEIKIPQPFTTKNLGVGAKKLGSPLRRTSFETIESYIPCLLLQPEETSDKIIIYFHGNGEDINLSYDLLMHVRNHLNVNVLGVEYPGYGLYKGAPTETAIMRDADAIHDFFVKKLKVKPQNIVIFGRSIGSGPATYLASQREIGALILMSAFTSIRDVVKDFAGKWAQYLIKQRFNNLEMIGKVNCPIFLIHGQKDKLIPYSHSEELHRACQGATELMLPLMMDHIEFDFYEDFTLPLISFLERCNISLTKSSVGIYFPKILFKTPDLILKDLQMNKESSQQNISE